MGMYTKTSVQNVFGFVRKKKLNKVLQRPWELTDGKVESA
jgi:uncharacterized protein YeeX (DUF496 family)